MEGRKSTYSKEQRQEALRRMRTAEHVEDIAKDMGIPFRTMGCWARREMIYDPCNYPQELLDAVKDDLGTMQIYKISKKHNIAERAVILFSKTVPGYKPFKLRQSGTRWDREYRARIAAEKQRWRDDQNLLRAWFKRLNTKTLFQSSLADRIKEHLEEVSEWKMAA